MKRILYIVWFGDEMSENRFYCYQSILNNSGIEVVLINETNYKNYIIEPHPRFNELNPPQYKADYIRAYMMYHHGGGYSDIKFINWDWNPYFNELENSDKDAIGYEELEGGVNKILPQHIRENHKQFIGCGHFIFKKHSNLAKKYLEQVEMILNRNKEVRWGELTGALHTSQCIAPNSTIKTMPPTFGAKSGIVYR